MINDRMTKTVLITGASSGIGFALAREFALKGYKVYAGSRNVEKMSPLKEYGVKTFALDVTSLKSIESAREVVESENGGVLDILYLNAGIIGHGAIFDLSLTAVKQVYETNVFGPLQLIRTFQGLLLKNQSTVVFTSSTAVHVQLPFNWMYASSKTSFDLLAKHLATETGKLGIKVVNVRTGAVESEIWEPPLVPPQESVYYVDGGKPLNAGFAPKKQVASVYAQNVVKDVERAMRREKYYTQVYRGSEALKAWIMSCIPFNTAIKLTHRILKMNWLFEAVRAKLGAT